MTKLIVFDMDGVIFEDTDFWMNLHKAFGTYAEGKKLTEKYLKTDYSKLVDEVVGRLWKEKDAKPYYDLVKKAKYVSGAKELFEELHKRGYKTAVISSGPSDLALRAKYDLGIDYVHTNELVIQKGKVTGEFIWPIGADRKQVILRNLCDKNNVFYKDCIAVVHATSDIKMAKTAGFAIGFNPEKEIEKYCKVIIRKKDLREVIKYI